VDPLAPKTVDALRAMVPHTVCVVDPSGRVATANPAWVAIFGPFDGATPKNFTDLVLPGDAPAVTGALERSRSGAPVEPLVLRSPSDGPAAVWFEWHLAPDGNGGVVVIGRDISQERRTREDTEELRMLEDEAERLAGLGSWRYDLRDQSVKFSPEMYRLLGIDPAAGVDLAQVVRLALKMDRVQADAAVQSAVQGPGLPPFERHRVDLPDGTFRWLNIQGRVVSDGDGSPVAIVGVAQDITDSMLADAALNASQERYRSIIDGMRDAYFRADTTGHLVLTNKAAADMYGFGSPEEMLGLEALTLYADADERDRALADMRSQGFLSDRVGRGRRRDGSIFWVSLNIAPVRDEAGNVVGTEGFARDITDRINSENALRESELKFRTIADFTYDWEAWTSPEGDLLYLSPAVERITGYTRDEFMADPGLVERIIHPQDPGHISGHLGQGGDRGPCPVTFRIIAKDGSERWIEHVCEAVTDSDGGDLGRRSSNRDITERILAQEERGTTVSLLQATLESTADGILVVDAGGRITSYNRRFTDMWGIPNSLVDAGDDPAVLDFAQHLLCEPGEFRAHVQHLYARPDAESFDTLELRDGRVFERYSRPQRLNSEVVGRVWSFRDVSMSAIAERALRRSEESLREAQAIARIGSYVFDIQNDVWTSSETMDDIFGIDWAYRRDFGGWLALVHADDREMMRAYVTEEVLGQHHLFDMPYRVTRHSDGSTVWAHGHGRLEFDSEGNALRLIGTIQDELRRSNASLERMVYDVAEAMGRVIEIRDQYTQGHQQRVARLSKSIAMEMKKPASDVVAVEMAAVVHDIGKLSVPSEILTRPGVLSPIEFAFIHEHPTHGYDILKDIPFPWPVADIVLQHHERMDGSGYPAGLRGADILPLARLLAVADVVEAMATHRPYRAALGIDAAMAELSTEQAKYDPDVVAACLRLYERGEIEFG